MTIRRYHGFSFRPYYAAADARYVRDLLVNLPKLYPDADRWLRDRLDGAASGRAQVTLAETGDQIAGVMIEVPESRTRLRLATLYVAPRFRRRGVAGQLLALAGERWRQVGYEEVYLTVPGTNRDRLMPMLMRRGFVPEAVLPGHYRPDRDEVVLTWRQGRAVPQVAVFSFKPEVPPLLWDGRKRHEYRRNRAVSLQAGSLVLVYETSPVKAVSGCFLAGQVTVGSPEQLVRLERGESRRLAQGFLEGAARASAIEVVSPFHFATPLALEPLTGLARPPMSYAFLRFSG